MIASRVNQTILKGLSRRKSDSELNDRWRYYHCVVYHYADGWLKLVQLPNYMNLSSLLHSTLIGQVKQLKNDIAIHWHRRTLYAISNMY